MAARPSERSPMIPGQGPEPRGVTPVAAFIQEGDETVQQ